MADVEETPPAYNDIIADGSSSLTVPPAPQQNSAIFFSSLAEESNVDVDVDVAAIEPVK